MKDIDAPKTEKRILWIAPRVPWPPSCGASVANCALISALAEKGWTIDLLCLTRSGEFRDLTEISSKLGLSSVEVIPFSFWMRFGLSRMILSFFLQLAYREVPLTAIPFVVGRVGRGIIMKIITGEQRMILWDGLHPMAALARREVSPRLQSFEKAFHIYRAHNCESALWSQYISRAIFFLRPLLSVQAKAMATLEKKCISLAALTLSISDSDRELLENLLPDNPGLTTVPVSMKLKLGVTDNHLLEKKRERFSDESTPLKLLWMGGMDWWPNREGLLWFLKRVWPALMGCKQKFQLDVIGKGTQQLRSISQGRIALHGFVPDPASYLQQADLLIVPIFSGAGIRVKALEAITHGIPCLGTSLGLSGIPREGCWLSQSSEDWCAILMSLTPEICRDRGNAGRRSVQQKHSPEVIGQQLDFLFSKLLQSDGNSDKR